MIETSKSETCSRKMKSMKHDRVAYLREYRKKKFLDNGKVEGTGYIDHALQTRSEWLEDMIRKDVRGLLCVEE